MSDHLSGTIGNTASSCFTGARPRGSSPEDVSGRSDTEKRHDSESEPSVNITFGILARIPSPTLSDYWPSSSKASRSTKKPRSSLFDVFHLRSRQPSTPETSSVWARENTKSELQNSGPTQGQGFKRNAKDVLEATGQLSAEVVSAVGKGHCGL